MVFANQLTLLYLTSGAFLQCNPNVAHLAVVGLVIAETLLFNNLNGALA